MIRRPLRGPRLASVAVGVGALVAVSLGAQVLQPGEAALQANVDQASTPPEATGITPTADAQGTSDGPGLMDRAAALDRSVAVRSPLPTAAATSTSVAPPPPPEPEPAPPVDDEPPAPEPEPARNGSDNSNEGGGNGGGGPAPRPDVPVADRPGGKPGPGNTGVPAGVQLRSVGEVNVTEAGTVLDGLRINCLRVRAPDVTVRNSFITCDEESPPVLVRGGSLTMVDSEVTSTGRADICVAHDSFVLVRVNVHNCLDGIRANGDVQVLDSWVHSLSRTPGSHNDTIQTMSGSNLRFEGNSLEPYRGDTDDPMNAAYIMKEDTGDISGVVFRNNYVNGGNFSLMLHGTRGGGFTDVVFSGNRFGRDHRYGVVATTGGGIQWSDNKYVDGEAIPLD